MRRGKGTKRRPSDEESLEVKGGKHDLANVTTCDGYRSSGSQGSRSNVSMWLDESQRIRRDDRIHHIRSKPSETQEQCNISPGFGRVEWREATNPREWDAGGGDSKATDRRKNMGQPVNDSESQAKTYESLMEKKDKGTGYDQPRQKMPSEEGRQREIDQHGNET